MTNSAVYKTMEFKIFIHGYNLVKDIEELLSHIREHYNIQCITYDLSVNGGRIKYASGKLYIQVIGHIEFTDEYLKAYVDEKKLKQCIEFNKPTLIFDGLDSLSFLK